VSSLWWSLVSWTLLVFGVGVLLGEHVQQWAGRDREVFDVPTLPRCTCPTGQGVTSDDRDDTDQHLAFCPRSSAQPEPDFPDPGIPERSPGWPWRRR